MLAPPPALGLLAGILWTVLGASLSLGLLLRQRWARWVGLAASTLLAGIGAVQIDRRGEALDFVVLLASAATLVLLALPGTGDARRGVAEGGAPRSTLGRALGWTSSASLVLLGIVAASTLLLSAEGHGKRPSTGDSPARGTSGFAPRSTLDSPSPASSSPRSAAASGMGGSRPGVPWSTFGAGLKRARADGRPMLVDFYADWCGACKIMDRTTFHHPDVVRRLADLVPVRVNAEDEAPHDGHVGTELAGRFAIRGYPTIVLLDPEGREISRRTGVLEPEVLLDWLDRKLGPEGLRAAQNQGILQAGRP